MNDTKTDLRVGQPEQQVILQLLNLLFVGLHLLHETLALLLQLVLLLQDKLAQQLVLQAGHGDCEVHQCYLGTQLRGVVGVGQAGGAEQPEAVCVVHLNMQQMTAQMISLVT